MKKNQNIEKQNKELGDKISKLNAELKNEKAAKKKLQVKEPVTNSDTQTPKTKTASIGTNTLFTKVDIDFDIHDQYISCLCKCHGDPLSEENCASDLIENCEIQLFKYTSDENAAVQSILYHDDYDDDFESTE